MAHKWKRKGRDAFLSKIGLKEMGQEKEKVYGNVSRYTR